MKRTFTHIFVILSNFYIVAYFLGLLLMVITAFVGGLEPIIGVLVLLLAFMASLTYELTRSRFKFISFGEQLIGNKDKRDILNQRSVFSISRIPILILILLTLAISGNILDGLSEGQAYKFGNVLMFGIIAGCFYYGMKNFMSKPELLPIILIIGGQMLAGTTFKYSSEASVTGGFIFNIYLGVSIIWLIVGWIYRRKEFKATTPSTK